MSALAADVDVGQVLLRVVGSKVGRGAEIEDRVTNGTIARTMDGASTLTIVVDDSDRTLLRSGVFNTQIDLQYDGLWWRLVQVQKQGTQLTLTFEDRIVALLRQITTPRKAARAKMTRAEFALSIVREVKQPGGPVPFVCPELHTVQPIAAASQRQTSSQQTAPGGGGFAPDARLTVKGAPASAQQKANAQRCLDVANSLGASGRAAVALIEAVIVESTITNPSSPSADGYGSRGILQVRDSTAQGMNISNTDIEACCNAFLTRGFTGRGGAIVLAAKNPSWTAGQIAQACQGSAFPTRYDQYRAEAERWVAAYGGSPSGGTVSTTTVVPYTFQRGGSAGQKEDSWACLQRLAQEVGWKCFAADGAVYFVAETTLVKARPAATLSEDTVGVSTIDFDVDNGKASSQATVTARASRLAFPPGSVVVLDNVGPADGRWLVADVSRGLFDAQATLTVKRAVKPLPEPAAATTTSTSSSGAVLGSGSPLIDKAYQAAQQIGAKRYPYVWGGGHAHCGTPDRGTGKDPGIGFDCSGSTCAVLGTAGMGFKLGGPVDVSGAIAGTWGDAGEGTYLTVWANAIHVWMEFKPPGQPPQHFGTGDWGKGWGGAGFNPQMHPKGGFTPRHWKGT